MNRGQSLIEVVFSIGLVILVITGVVMLLINTVGSRTKSYERIKAVELSQIVMERLVLTKNSNASQFWDLNSEFWIDLLDRNIVDVNFPDYNYRINVTPNTSNGCTATTCFDVVVGIGWSGSIDGNRDNFNRFFSRK